MLSGSAVSTATTTKRGLQDYFHSHDSWVHTFESSSVMPHHGRLQTLAADRERIELSGVLASHGMSRRTVLRVRIPLPVVPAGSTREYSTIA